MRDVSNFVTCSGAASFESLMCKRLYLAVILTALTGENVFLAPSKKRPTAIFVNVSLFLFLIGQTQGHKYYGGAKVCSCFLHFYSDQEQKKS